LSQVQKTWLVFCVHLTVNVSVWSMFQEDLHEANSRGYRTPSLSGRPYINTKNLLLSCSSSSFNTAHFFRLPFQFPSRRRRVYYLEFEFVKPCLSVEIPLKVC